MTVTIHSRWNSKCVITKAKKTEQAIAEARHILAKEHAQRVLTRSKGLGMSYLQELRTYRWGGL